VPFGNPDLFDESITVLSLDNLDSASDSGLLAVMSSDAMLISSIGGGEFICATSSNGIAGSTGSGAGFVMTCASCFAMML